MEVSQNRSTPNFHPFIDGNFHEMNHLLVSPVMELPHINNNDNDNDLSNIPKITSMDNDNDHDNNYI